MRFSLLALVTCSLVVLAACEKPCPKGQQRYGAKCVMSPVYDAGLDGVDAGGEPELSDGGAGESTMDGGEPMSCVPPACHPCDQDPCGMGGICSEIDTGFECTCKVGFSGKKCEVDVCDLSPCVHGACVRTPVGRTCECDANYVGDTCDKNTDATLAALTVSVGTLFPAFSASVFEYSVDLGISEPDLSVIATAAVPDGVVLKVDGTASPSGSDSRPYAIGVNAARTVLLEIVAEDGSKLAYHLTIRRSLVQRAYVKRQPSAAGELFGGSIGDWGVSYWGGSLAVEGDLAAVGHLKGAGAVELFARTPAGWARRFPVGAGAFAKPGALFGAVVDMTPQWLVVGAPGESADAGAAYAVRRSTLGDTILDIHQLLPSVSEAGQRFGGSIAAEGDLIAVGAFKEDVDVDGSTIAGAGAAYVFEFDGNQWTGPLRIVSPNPAASGLFGVSVAIDGGRVVIGAPAEDAEADDEGAVYAFEKSGATWTVTSTLRVKGSTLLGMSVDANQGRIAAVTPRLCLGGLGCLGRPEVHVFSVVGDTWTEDPVFDLPRPEDTAGALDALQFGASGIALSGKMLVVPAMGERLQASGVNPVRDPGLGSAEDTGAAYVFVRHADGWRADGYLKASNAEGRDFFGMSIAAADDTVFVAAPGEASSAQGITSDIEAQSNNDASESGAVYIFSTNCANVPSGAAVPGC